MGNLRADWRAFWTWMAFPMGFEKAVSKGYYLGLLMERLMELPLVEEFGRCIYLDYRQKDLCQNEPKQNIGRWDINKRHWVARKRKRNIQWHFLQLVHPSDAFPLQISSTG